MSQRKKIFDENFVVDVTIRQNTRNYYLFNQFLQYGVDVWISAPLSVRAFLTDVLGLDAQYVEKNVSTIFVDGHPVDDIDTAEVAAGTELALSGPLPGVCGITMRRQSPVARMRCGIAYDAFEHEEHFGAGFVRMKVFNFILRDISARLWQRGCIVPADRLCSLLDDADKGLDIVSASIAGNDISPASLSSSIQAAATARVRLSVEEIPAA